MKVFASMELSFNDLVEGNEEESLWLDHENDDASAMAYLVVAGFVRV